MLSNELKKSNLTNGDIIEFYYTKGTNPHGKRSNMTYISSDVNHLYAQESNGQYKTYTLSAVYGLKVIKHNGPYEKDKENVEKFIIANPGYSTTLVSEFNKRWNVNLRFDVVPNKLVDNSKKVYTLEINRDPNGKISNVNIIGCGVTLNFPKADYPRLARALEDCV